MLSADCGNLLIIQVLMANVFDQVAIEFLSQPPQEFNTLLVQIKVVETDSL